MRFIFPERYFYVQFFVFCKLRDKHNILGPYSEKKKSGTPGGQFQAVPNLCHFGLSDQILVLDVRKLCGKFHAFLNSISKPNLSYRKYRK